MNFKSLKITIEINLKFMMIALFFFLFNSLLFSQLEDNNRIFLGDKISSKFYYIDKINFNKCTNEPYFNYHFQQMKHTFGLIINSHFNSISDKKTGELLFFTDGIKVYNMKFELMDNGDSICTINNNLAIERDWERRCIIVPVPNTISNYYIFSIGTSGTFNPQKSINYTSIEYSIIDISLNNGLGKVLKKANSIDTNIYKYYSISIISHKNGNDFWLLAKDTCGNISIFLVDSKGIKLKNIKSFKNITNLLHIDYYSENNYDNFYYQNWLTMKVSPNGKCILLFDLGNVFSDSLSKNNNLYKLFNHQIIANFNNETGELENPITLYNPRAINYHLIEYFFTPDSKRLFIIENNFKKINEIDLSKWDSVQISNSIQTKTIKSIDGITYSYKDYPLRDGRLYIQSDSMILKRNIIKIDNLNDGILNKNIDFDYLKLNLDNETKWIFNGDLVYNSFIYHAFLYHFIDYKKPVCETQKLEFDLLPFVPKGAEEDPKVFFEWKGPENFFSLLRKPTIDSVTPKNSGWYYLTLFTQEDTLRDSLYIDIPLKNYIKIQANKNIPCPGDTVTLKIDSIFKSIYWNTGDSTKSIKVTKPGKYTVMIEDDNCCNSYDEIEVVYSIPPNPEIEIIGNNPSCYGDTVIIKPKYDYPIFTWDDGDTNRIRKITKTSAFELTVIDSNGCSAKSNIEIKFANKPKPTISGNTKICLGTVSDYIITTGKTTKKEIKISGGIIQSQTESELKILWNQVGDYSIEIIESDTVNGCIGKTRLNIKVDSLKKPTIIQENPLCTGFESKLSVKESFDTYQWSTGETTQSISISKGGTYKVVCTLAGGCMDSSEITITESPKPNIEIKSKNGNILCQKGDKIELYCELQEIDFNYLWNINETTPNITISDSGTYNLIVSNANGCSDTATFRIDLAPEIQAKINSNTDRICKGEIAELTAEPIENKYQYFWNTGKNTPKISVSDSGEYKLKITNEFGCSKEISKRIELNPTINIEIDTTKAKIGELANLILKLSSNDKIQLSNVEINLSIDKSSIYLTENQPNIQFKTKDKELDITLKIAQLDFTSTKEHKFLIEGLALLADSLENEIQLKSLNLNSNEYCIEKQNGALLIEDICTFKLRKIKLIENYLTINPNPASDYIEISLSPAGGGRGWTVEIYNIFGEVQKLPRPSDTPSKEGEFLRIDISNLPTGVYLIKIGNQFEKFVKI